MWRRVYHPTASVLFRTLTLFDTGTDIATQLFSVSVIQVQVFFSSFVTPVRLFWQMSDFSSAVRIFELIDWNVILHVPYTKKCFLVPRPSFFSVFQEICNIFFFFIRIHHYCGPVTYTVSCFAEKNQDFLPKHISSGMYQSKLHIMQYLFPEGNPKKSSKKPTSISSNLRTSLQALLQNLSQRRNHYVFCIRPNEFKEPRAFELPLVQHQVRYLA